MKRIAAYIFLFLLFIVSRMALAETQADNISRAREIFEELLVKTPNDPDIYLYLADIYSTEGLRTKAKEFYIKYSEFKPADYIPYYRIGESEWGAGNTKEAKKYFAKSLSLISNQKSNLQMEIDEARMAALSGDKDRSDELYNKLLVAHPDDVNVLVSRINTLMDIDRSKAAYPLAAKAVSEHPDDYDLNRGFARAAAMESHFGESRRILNSMMSKYPDDRALKADYANVLYQEGYWHEAWPMFNELAANAPENIGYQDMLNSLFQEHRPTLEFAFEGLFNGPDRVYGPVFRFINPINSRWAFEANYTLHRDSTNVAGFNPDYWVYTNEINLLAHYKPHPQVELAAGIGNNIVGQKYFPSALAFATWKHPVYGQLGFNLNYNGIFDNPVAGLYFDGRRDLVGFTYEVTLLKRIILSAEYDSIWYRVNGSKTGTGGGNDFGREDFAVPGIQFIVLRDPEIRLGYAFYYTNLHVVNNYLNIIPLIQAQQQQTIFFALSHEWDNRYLLEVGGFTGKDPKRNLNFSGLYGFNAGGRARLTKRLDMIGRYEYSSANLLNNLGHYQYFNLGLLYRF